MASVGLKARESPEPDPLALALEGPDGDIARVRESRAGVERSPSERPSDRKPLPDHLPRENVLLDIGGTVCTCWGGAPGVRASATRSTGFRRSFAWSASRDPNARAVSANGRTYSGFDNKSQIAHNFAWS